MRALTERQARALRLLAQGHLSHSTSRSMPSLEGRGLVKRCWKPFGGRHYRSWQITDLGQAEARRLRAAEEEAGTSLFSLTKLCPSCGKRSTVLLSQGVCGHCGHRPEPTP
jgi:DNA-binding PadR family transcriptional regulator